MTDLRTLLEKREIRKTVIIDDVYDDTPRPDELDAGDWSNFFDDLGEAEHKLLAQIYSGYEDASPDELQTSQNFIDVLWENRKNLPNTACDPLFGTYESTNAIERGGLDTLVRALEELGLACTTMGRELDEEAKEADLIFVDLFLGFQQSGDDMDRAIQRVRELVADRAERPPLVVLMSKSPRLAAKRSDFRDNAGLLGSTFRFISKVDLAKEGTLETMLTRLASHYEDAKRVAGFVHAWDRGLDEARNRFIQTIRRLDLSDMAQIRALLLEFEGQALGEYLLDVADRVMQYEIEADIGTIAAAKDLNTIELENYPAPHLEGTPDLQDLVHQMIFQNRERLQLSTTESETQLQLGDVIRAFDKRSHRETEKVFLVVTPACDLVRGGTDNVLVLPGTLRPLGVSDWSYKSTGVKTPIFTAADGMRYWIQWNLKARLTIPSDALCKQIREEQTLKRVGRLRETFALEIQQRLLAEMGRVGQPANPPATFPVSIALFAVSAEGTARAMEVKGLESAVCFVGRDKDSKRVDRLVLSESACDALRNAVSELEDQAVHTIARPSLNAMKSNVDFFSRFERGEIEIPHNDNKASPEKGGDNLVYILIYRNEGVEEGDKITGSGRNSPLLMKISDVSNSNES